jgi:CRP-like cAMP-binding protein
MSRYFPERSTTRSNGLKTRSSASICNRRRSIFHRSRSYELEIFKNHKEETLIDPGGSLERRSVPKGRMTKVFSLGDVANELYLIRKGAVRITFPSAREQPTFITP